MLTDRQTRFVEEYLRAPSDAAGAALRAGYSPGRARRQARALLDMPEVRARIERERDAAVRPEQIIRELARIAFADPADFFVGAQAVTVGRDDLGAPPACLAMTDYPAPGGPWTGENGAPSRRALQGKENVAAPGASPRPTDKAADPPPVGADAGGPWTGENGAPSRRALQGKENVAAPGASPRPTDDVGAAVPGASPRPTDKAPGPPPVGADAPGGPWTGENGAPSRRALQGKENVAAPGASPRPTDKAADPPPVGADAPGGPPLPSLPAGLRPGSGTGLKLKYTPKRGADGQTVFELSMEREVRVGDKLRALELLSKYLGLSVPPAAGGDGDDGDEPAGGLIVLPEIETEAEE